MALQAPKDLRVKLDVDYAFLERAMEALANPARLRLLGYLSHPHYLEEIASHLKLTRQAARKHLDRLVEVGILDRRPGVRETGPVTEYVLNPRALFLLHDEVEKLGGLPSEGTPDILVRTRVETGGKEGAEIPPGPALYTVRGLGTGRRHALSPSGGRQWTIGRDERCEVVVAHDPYASNRHAEVRWEQGRFVLADLGSSNGTLHNWAPIPRGGSAPLQHGDVVGVGRTLLLFWEAARRA